MGTKSTYDIAVGNAIKKARLAAGKTQSEVALELNSHTHSIYQYESGTRQVTPNTAYALASSLGTSPKEFYPDPAEIAAQIKKGNYGKREKEEE